MVAFITPKEVQPLAISHHNKMVKTFHRHHLSLRKKTKFK